MLSISIASWSFIFWHWTLTFFPILTAETVGVVTFQTLPLSSRNTAFPLCSVHERSHVALAVSCFTHFWSQMVPVMSVALLLSWAETNILIQQTRTINPIIRFMCVLLTCRDRDNDLGVAIVGDRTSPSRSDPMRRSQQMRRAETIRRWYWRYLGIGQRGVDHSRLSFVNRLAYLR